MAMNSESRWYAASTGVHPPTVEQWRGAARAVAEQGGPDGFMVVEEDAFIELACRLGGGVPIASPSDLPSGHVTVRLGSVCKRHPGSQRIVIAITQKAR
jgi:hypothetical protein